MAYTEGAYLHLRTGTMPMPAMFSLRSMRIAALLLGGGLLLAACSGPPVFERSASRAPASASSTVAPGFGDRVHEIVRGDTVYAVARQYGLSTRDIIDANGLQPPYRLNPGQRLVIPGQRIHVVARGDTLYAVSRRYDVDMASLARINGMGEPYTIFVGQQLRLPTPGDGMRVASVPATIGGRAVTLQQPVGAGDAVSTTALTDPAAAGSPVAADGAVDGAPRAPQVASLPPVDHGIGEPKSKSLAPARSGPVPPPPASAGRFIWPVEGRVIERFGAKAGNLHNDGLNIAAPRGAPVRAVDNGVVAYAGDRIRGFGQMVLLKHENGLITAYAHNDALLVERGDIVNRGQVIARVGSSGGVATPQLHFEVRKGTVAVDPAQYLPG
jgi:murein DD-endopeptidase MepM/ murein hydrolase activator NlpD